MMQGMAGFNESNGRFKEIIDMYNNVKPLPRGYAVKYSDEWCDTCVSAAAVKAGCEELIGRVCGVEKHIEIFKHQRQSCDRGLHEDLQKGCRTERLCWDKSTHRMTVKKTNRIR